MEQKKNTGLTEILTVLSVISFSLAVYSCPRVSDLFVYNRKAVADGEIWRIFTAPLVHFSVSHMFWNALVFGAAGLAVHLSGFRRFWIVCAAAAFLPGLIYFYLFTDLECYGGLSGPATGAVVYFCLCSYMSHGREKMYLLILLLT